VLVDHAVLRDGVTNLSVAVVVLLLLSVGVAIAAITLPQVHDNHHAITSANCVASCSNSSFVTIANTKRTNRSINQPTNQPTNQSINQSINQTNEPTSKLLC
jgi:tellurite resistance protein TehA-like permease